MAELLDLACDQATKATQLLAKMEASTETNSITESRYVGTQKTSMQEDEVKARGKSTYSLKLCGY